MHTKTKVISVGTFLPDQIVKSDDIFKEIDSERYGLPVTWMSDEMGIIERRMSNDDTVPSELAIPAAQKALDTCGINKDHIDLIIFCGIERDRPEPATAHIIQDQLGLKAEHVFDVANACYGFMDGVCIASNFIRSKLVRYALIVTGEVPTRVLRSFVRQLKAGVDLPTAKKMIGGLSVGDAGGAVVLGASEIGEQAGFESFIKNVDSSHNDKCQYRVRGDGEIEGQMLMAKISAYGFKLHKQIIHQTLDSAGWDSFDWMLSHQTGSRNFEQISSMNIVPKAKIIKTYDRLANITSATFPLNYEKMCETGEVEPGDRIGGCFAGSGLTIGQFCYSF